MLATEEPSFKRMWSGTNSVLTDPGLEEERRQYQQNLKDLAKCLGPEWVLERAGPGGRKVPYVGGGAAIWLANHFFGHDGWSSEIIKEEIDLGLDKDNKWVAHATITTRVVVHWKISGSLERRTTHHDGKGYGGNKPQRTKGEALEGAIKEAETDSFKRALRYFGDALGNSLYREECRQFISRIRAREGKLDLSKQFDAGQLFRMVLDCKQTGVAAPISEVKPRRTEAGLKPAIVDEDEFGDEWAGEDLDDF